MKLPGPNGEMPKDSGEGADNAAQEQEFDKDALADKIHDKFAAAFGDDADDDYEEENDEVIDTDDDDEADQDDDEGSASDADDDDDEAGSDAGDVDDGDADDPTIPTAHERSLKAYHTEKELKQLRKSLGDEGFADYAARTHDKRNADTARQAELGRMFKTIRGDQQQEPNPQGDGTPKPNQQSQQQALASLKPLDVAKLKEKYGDDEFIQELAAHSNAQTAVVNAVLEDLKKSQQFAQQSEQEQLAQKVEQFFTGDAMKPYAKLYGTADRQVTDEQWEQRNKVLEMADAILTGAEFQGRQMTPEQAMAAAHDALSGDYKESTVRNKIKKQAKQRNRGITNRPSNRRSDGKPSLERKGKPKDKRELESRTRSRLKAVFG